MQLKVKTCFCYLVCPVNTCDVSIFYTFSLKSVLLFTGTYRVSKTESPSCSPVSRRKERWWRWWTKWRKWSSGASQSFSSGGVLREEGEWRVSQRKERGKGDTTPVSCLCRVVSWSDFIIFKAISVSTLKHRPGYNLFTVATTIVDDPVLFSLNMKWWTMVTLCIFPSKHLTVNDWKCVSKTVYKGDWAHRSRVPPL